MQLFYCNTGFSGTEGVLNAEESYHCIRVLRHCEGETIEVVDGKGNFAEAIIITEDSKACRFNITKLISGFKQKPYYLHIAIAPTKNTDRTEWFVEKAVEFGIDEISFINCQRSERKHINLERMHKIAVSAMKQSVKASLPTIHPIIDFNKFMGQPLQLKKYIAHCVDVEKAYLAKAMATAEYSLVLIGPEGDFSEQEIEVAQQLGFMGVSLGNSRLRTETAGVAACHIAALINEMKQ